MYVLKYILKKTAKDHGQNATPKNSRKTTQRRKTNTRKKTHHTKNKAISSPKYSRISSMGCRLYCMRSD